MEQEKRINQGYEIIESCTIGSKELVIGHHRFSASGQGDCYRAYDAPHCTVHSDFPSPPKQKNGDDRER